MYIYSISICTVNKNQTKVKNGTNNLFEGRTAISGKHVDKFCQTLLFHSISLLFILLNM